MAIELFFQKKMIVFYLCERTDLGGGRLAYN